MKRGKHILRILLAVAAVMLVAGGGVAWWLYSRATDAWHGSEPVRIYIPAGSTVEQVNDSLRTVLGDAFGSNVAWLWQQQKGRPAVAEGSYVVSPGAKALAVSRMLLHGLQTPVKLTFNNVRTMPQLAARVSAQLEVDSAAFMAACDSLLPEAGFKKAEFIAAFLPDTYEFYWNAKAPKVVSRLLDARNAFWTAARRAQASAMGLRPVQVATIASIVEEETSKADERPKVARLYLNRLDKGMMLQADPTVKYAIVDFTLRRITNAHLKHESPYNTYLHAGLPPGPIRMPAASTLKAVLDAPKHPYIYMCAKEDFSGYHNFATDYPTHLANARRYQQELNRRGIK